MDNYIVRIYRREKGNPRILVGTVEEAGVDDRQAFTNYNELWEILNPGTHASPAKGAPLMNKKKSRDLPS